ncbi:MAG: hypothetical protein KDA61_21930 [Planctomycetales bacterium]|nr:hypothetical protein [Planctomycetales bacterium]
MNSWNWQTVVDWESDAEALRRRRYGVIESRAGRCVAVHLRPFPKWLAWPDFWPVGPTYRARGEADRFLLYYNQPMGHSNFLAVRYAASTLGTSYTTLRSALTALDRLAELKGTDAMLCDAANRRISDRLLARFGWEPHKPQRFHRNFIKRFYGVYPSCPSILLSKNGV